MPAGIASAGEFRFYSTTAEPMDDKLKNRVLITVLAVCWAFMVWFWFLTGHGFAGAFVSLIVAAVVGGITWFVAGVLT